MKNYEIIKTIIEFTDKMTWGDYMRSEEALVTDIKYIYGKNEVIGYYLYNILSDFINEQLNQNYSPEYYFGLN